MPEYQFVPFGNTNGSNATKAARSHAIRTALHRRNASVPRQEVATRGDVPKAAGEPGLKGRFRLSLKDEIKPQQRQKAVAEWASISKKSRTIEAKPAAKISIPRLKDSHLDPFNSMPIPTSPAVEALLQFFVKGFKLNFSSSSIDTQRPWLPYAMQSPVVMRATLALAAGFWAASMPSLDARLRHEGCLQKGETMGLIRKHLNTSHSGVVSQEDALVLSGMATLANVEAFNGEFITADIHLKGLHDIVMSRGGPATILHDYILCRCIQWVDVQVASGLGRLPVFPPLHTLEQVILPAKVVAQAAEPPLRYLTEDTKTSKPNARAAALTIFILLRQSIASQQAWALMDADSIRIIMSTADNYILSLLFAGREDGRKLVLPAEPLGDYGDTESITALVMAAHVFLYAALRAVPPTSQLLRVLCCRLRGFLERASGPGDSLETAARLVAKWDSHIALLIWISFAGVVGAGCTPLNAGNGQWFASLFHLAVRRAQDDGILDSAGNDDAVRTLLASFLWKDMYCGTVLESLRQTNT